MPYQNAKPQTVEWETPPELFERLNRLYGFDLDVCASDSNAKCARYFTAADDGLAQAWHGTCWMNPPYGRPLAQWMQKAESERRRCRVIVCLVPARTDTKWFHEYVHGKAEIYFIRGRIRFLREGLPMQGANFPSMIVVYRAHDSSATFSFEKGHKSLSLTVVPE